MHVEPDARAAADERTALARITATTLARVGLNVDPDEAAHPAVSEIAHMARDVLRADTSDGPRPALARTLDEARAGIRVPDPLWPIELAPPRAHLHRAAARAAVPGPPDRAVVAWRASDVEAFDRTMHLLGTVWPQARDELTECTRQIALVRGQAPSARPDFVIHGAILLDRARVGALPHDLPSRVRLAERLVDEAAHTRCNAAAVVAEPLLRPIAATPSGADHHTLADLLRQAVVLTRRMLLHERVLGHHPAPPAYLRERGDRPASDAAAVSATLARHRDAFTDRGNAVLDDVAALVRAHAGERPPLGTRARAR